MSSREQGISGAAHNDGQPPGLSGDRSQPMDAERDALSMRLAERFCNRHGTDCDWYHGEWELLKSLGIVSSSAVHAPQLLALLRTALKGLPHQPRILVSGSTDDSLLRIIHEGMGTGSADIVALDICATPLELMRDYATSRELSYEAICANILDHADEQAYDLILTHAFMGNFSDLERARLVAKWASLLRPRGRVVTIQRIRPPGTPAVIGFTAEQADAFVRAALASAARQGMEDSRRVERVARTFTQKFRTHSITSRTDFKALFIDVGLELIHLEYHKLSPFGGLSGPSVPSGGEYAFLIAGKENTR